MSARQRGGSERALLGHQGEGVGADGGAGHQADGQASQRGWVVDPHHRLEGGTDGIDIGLLAAGLATSRVQDVATVQHEDQHVYFGGLHTRLGGALLRINTAKQNHW